MNFIKRIISRISLFIQWIIGRHKKSSDECKEGIDLENEYRRAISTVDKRLKEEIRSLYKKYEAEYATLEKRFESFDGKTNPEFIKLEKELDEKYKSFSKVIGEKFADMKNKLDIDFFNSFAGAHFKNRQNSTK